MELLEGVGEVLGEPLTQGLAGMGLSQIPDPTAEIQRQLVDAKSKKGYKPAEAYARLQILDRLETDFLIFISHELRTPLSSMVAVDLLDPSGDLMMQAKTISRLPQGYKRLEGLLASVLPISGRGVKISLCLTSAYVKSQSKRESTQATN